MKYFLLIIFLNLFITQSNLAKACSYIIDEKLKANELQQVALSSLSDVQVLNVTIEQFNYFESKSTPMCPEELTYEAKINVVYKNNNSKCIIVLNVKKVESWKENFDNYNVTGKKTARCTRL